MGLKVAVLALVSCALLPACSRPSAESAPLPQVQVDEADDPNVVTVPHPEQFPVAEAIERDTHSELQAPGVVAADISRTVPVVSLAGGRVVDVRARLGDTVRKGQVLVTIESPDVSQTRADMKKYSADADLARKALDRARALSEHEALAAKDLEAAVNADARAQADLRTARERLELLAGSASESGSSLVELKAPVSGAVIEQNVTSSAGVKSLDNSPNLFTIADLSRVWVLCDVNENNLGEVRVNDSATVVLNAYPNRPLRARVANISRVLDPGTRTAKVRLELANPEGLLRPGMFAAVTFTAQQMRKTAVVPSSAVLRLHDKDWVFTPIGGQRFRLTEIQSGRDQNGLLEVSAGLRPGDRVVTNALQLSSAATQQ
jgi:membrane fusion protein, heavy metal efflux system